MTPTTESSLPSHKEKKKEEETEQKKRKEDLLNKFINKPPTTTIPKRGSRTDYLRVNLESKKRRDKPSIIISFSVSPTDEKAVTILNEFNEIAKREAGPRGRSLIFLRAMAEYNIRHGLGNPQILITTYMSPQAPSPMRVVCWSNLAGATSDGKVYCRKYGGWIQAIKCYSCSDNQLKKKGPK